MKKVLINFTAICLLSGYAMAQNNFSPSYTEEIYRITDNSALSGTARYRALSGAMGALGGDISSTMTNPAAGAVILNSEAALTAGINNYKSSYKKNDRTHTEMQLSSAGAVLMFNDLDSKDWINMSMSINYEKKSSTRELYAVEEKILSKDVAGNYLEETYTERNQDVDLTNVGLAANYRDRVYLGLGMNFHSYSTSSYDRLREFTASDGKAYTYTRDYTPTTRKGEGISFNLGLIGKLNQNIRVGLAYHTPTWYADNEEVVTRYAMYKSSGSDAKYYIDKELKGFLNNMVSAHKVTGSLAFVGKMGLISADYSYTDYSTAKYRPENDFKGENKYISQDMKASSSLRVGAELRLNDFKIRGGYRYETSPFEEIKLKLGSEEVSYKPYGDLSGFSAGVGYDFKGFYIDASYDMFSRDRNHLIYGNYYDTSSNIKVSSVSNDQEALNVLSMDAVGAGYGQSIKDLKEQQGQVNLTVGFRF